MSFQESGKTMKKYITSAVLGILVGLLTLVGQKYLPMNFNFLANSGSMWLIPAFFMCYIFGDKKFRAMALGVETLLFCVIGYYAFEAVLNQHTFSTGRWMIIWLVVSVAAGVIFGLGAFFARHTEGFFKYIGLNLMPAVFTSEGVSKIIHIADYSHMIPAVVMTTCIGLALYFIINRRECVRWQNIVSYAALTLLGTGAFIILAGF